MNERIKQLAEQAGFPERRVFSDLSDLYPRLERFAALVAAAEREECAKVCDALADKDKLSNYYRVAANAIRNRSNT